MKITLSAQKCEWCSDGCVNTHSCLNCGVVSCARCMVENRACHHSNTKELEERKLLICDGCEFEFGEGDVVFLIVRRNVAKDGGIKPYADEGYRHLCVTCYQDTSTVGTEHAPNRLSSTNQKPVPPRMIKAHFELIAATVESQVLDYQQRRRLALYFADVLRLTNPNFSVSRFVKACGVVYTPTDAAEQLKSQQRTMQTATFEDQGGE